MIKAVFMDYTGTMVKEDEPYTRELVGYFASHSDLKDPNEILKVVWTRIKIIEAKSFGDSFLLNDEKIDLIWNTAPGNTALRVILPTFMRYGTKCGFTPPSLKM